MQNHSGGILRGDDRRLTTHFRSVLKDLSGDLSVPLELYSCHRQHSRVFFLRGMHLFADTVRKCRVFTEVFWSECGPLEKGMANHFSILPLRTPRAVCLMKRQKNRTLKDELPRPVGAQYVTGDRWTNNSRKNEEMEPKQKQHPVVDVTGDRSKARCCKEQYCIGIWNVRSMNQGKLKVVKQMMARVNIVLGIRELKWNEWVNLT